MEEDEGMMACMSLREWNELVEIVKRLAEVNGIESKDF